MACKSPNSPVGECGFLIIGNKHFVIIVVKNMRSLRETKQHDLGLDEQQHKLGLQGSFNKSDKHRKRMVKLIRSIEKSTNITVQLRMVYQGY